MLPFGRVCLVCLGAVTLLRASEPLAPETLRADLTFLASDSLDGRLSLTTGSEVAVQWIQAEFSKAGLSPAANGSYLQKVPLWEFRPNRDTSGLDVSRGGEKQSWKYPEAYGQFPENVDVSGDVVFAGYGITAPELHYDDYQGLNATGKVALIFDHEPQENDEHSIFNGKGNTRYATTRVKALNAQAHGAVALLIVAEPNRKHVSNQERLAKITGQGQRTARIPAEAIVGDELHIPTMVVSDAAAAGLLKNAGATPTELQTKIDAGLLPASRPLAQTTARLHMDNTESRRKISYNVAGLLTGSDPQLAAETVIYSAHYDHDGASSDKIWHGADDNGSGTVGVVELAHALVTGPRPKRSLLFIVFAAEERGLLGSYYYLENPLRPLDRTRAVINFDMIGRNETPSAQTNGVIDIAPDTSNELNLIGTNYTPEYRQTVERANEKVRLHLNYKWDAEASLNVFFRSDQFPFALRGIPAIWWFTGFHPDYHQPTDTADRINYDKMSKILRLAYLSGQEFANEEKTPVFHPSTK